MQMKRAFLCPIKISARRKPMPAFAHLTTETWTRRGAKQQRRRCATPFQKQHGEFDMNASTLNKFTISGIAAVLLLPWLSVAAAGESANAPHDPVVLDRHSALGANDRSAEQTSELQSLMRLSYAVFCFKQNNYTNTQYKAATL